MNKKTLHLAALIILFLSSATLGLSQIDKSAVKDLYAQIELFSYALTMIQSEYVEEKTPQDLIYGSLRGMLSSLDPHSQFMDPEEYKELKSETSGKFGGLGVEITVRDGLLTVVTPIDDTPAWKVGLKAGDRIVKIEDELTRDLTLNDAVKKLRGDPGTDVHITVLREAEFKILDFTITREIIEVQDVKYPQILEDHIAYIRLAEFREDSGRDFAAALKTLREDEADSLIIDLRNNPGGLLSVALDITEMFLPKGTLLLSTRGRRPAQDTETFSRGADEDKILDWPIVVMINEGSASGSEILAGALKDNHRAVTLGTQSFGKGSVQSVLPLPDGSGLRLTTSKYFTPSGISIHGTGITPDIVVKRVYYQDSQYEEREKRLEKLFDKVEKNSNGDSPDEPEDAAGDDEGDDEEEDSAVETEEEIHERLLNDNQIQSAINVIKGIRVYGNTEGDSSATVEVEKALDTLEGEKTDTENPNI